MEENRDRKAIDIRSIVVPTDFSELSRSAVARAVSLARLDGASIHLVHIVRAPSIAVCHEAFIPAAVWKGARRAAQEKLEAERKRVEAMGISTVTAELLASTDVAQLIAAAVEAHAADLVVMGTHGHTGIRHALLGSFAERTLRTIDRPILAVKEDPHSAAEAIERILVAVDFSTHSDRAVEVAAGLARRFAATVDVVHAFDLPWDSELYEVPYMTELEEKIQASANERLERVGECFAESQLSATLHSSRGSPSVVIAKAAAEIGCQLIVMGTRGNSGLSHVLLGSVAERTLRTAPCSVLVVRAGDLKARAGG